MSEIDLSQPRHETAFWWRHSGPVTSQLTDPIKWPIYPLKLIGIYVHIDTNNKESLTQRWRISTNVQLCIVFDIFVYIYLVRQPTKHWCSFVLTLKYTYICVYWWARHRIHNTLIVVDRYLRLMGDKTIPDSAEPRLESFYPPFVAGIDLPHQGVVDSYSLIHSAIWDQCQVSEINYPTLGWDNIRLL